MKKLKGLALIGFFLIINTMFAGTDRRMRTDPDSNEDIHVTAKSSLGTKITQLYSCVLHAIQ